MGIFSSSWKYYAYAGSSTIFDEKDHPHTFQQIMLEGLRVDESFSNILAFAFRTDMYARSKAMVKYALKEPDGYIRGLPTSDLLTFNIELEYVRGSVKRDVKVPIEDFYWFQHGTFDPSFLVRKFIHDNYLNINYFPWPEGCLTPLLNPRFDDVAANWEIIGTVDVLPQYAGGLDYTARLIANSPRITNAAIGTVVPGDVITLTAACDRGGDPNIGTLNLTFYNILNAEIATYSAMNSAGVENEWQHLTVTATAPVASTTVRAWAGVGGEPDFLFTVRTTVVSETFIIRCQNVGVFNAVIDWGDAGPTSSVTTFNGAGLTHIYAVAGDYQIRISGTFPNIYMNNVGPHDLKIRSVENLGSVGWTRLDNAFYGCSNMTSFQCGNCDTSLVTSMRYMFRQCDTATVINVSNLNTGSVTDFLGMFQHCYLVESLDVTGFNTSAATNMQSMFSYCQTITSLDVSGFDLTSVTTLDNVFSQCLSLTSISLFDVTGVPILRQMFTYCQSLPTVDVSTWNTSSATTIDGMFDGCDVLTSVDVSGWDTGLVTDMNYAFSYCPLLTGVEISGWNVSSLTNGQEMFVFSPGALNTTEYDATLIAWGAQTVVTGVVRVYFGETVQYTVGAASAGKAALEAEGWLITDGGFPGQAFPVIESISRNDTTSGAVTSFTIDMPSGVVSGNLLLVFATNDQATAADAGFSIDGSGWAKLGESGNATSDCHIAVFWKIATGAEGTRTITATNGGVPLNFAVRISGAHPLYPIDAPYSFFSQIFSNSTSHGVGLRTYVAHGLALFGLAFDGSDGHTFSGLSTFAIEDQSFNDPSGLESANGISACWGSAEVHPSAFILPDTLTSSVADMSALSRLTIKPPIS